MMLPIPGGLFNNQYKGIERIAKVPVQEAEGRTKPILTVDLSTAEHLQFLRDDLLAAENCGTPSVIAYLKYRIAMLEAAMGRGG